jgi:membrane-bound lytic murein transglycosylase F
MRALPRLSACLLALLCVSVAAAGDLPEIKSKGALRVLMVPANSPIPGPSPFFSIDGDRATGFDAEVLAAFARGEGLKLSVTAIPIWDSLIPALLQDKGDLIAGDITATQGRRKQIDFTTEVLPTRIVVLSRKPHARVATREQLLAERVGTVKGTSPHEALLAIGVPKQNLDDTLQPTALLEAMKSGRFGAIAIDLQAAVDAQRRDPELELGMFLGAPESLAYGVRKEAPLLRKALDRHIESMKPTPAWYRLVVQYFGNSAPDIMKRARAEN